MKLPIALGIAAAALTVAAASAHSSNSRHVVIHGNTSSFSTIDANEDGWVTRTEASSGFERIFADLDSNDDGKLDDADRHEINFNVDVDGPHVRIIRSDNGDVRVIRDDLDEETEERIEREVERAVEQAEEHAERAERDAERAERHAERVEREVERAVERAEREAERDAQRSGHRVQRFRDGDRQVIIIRDGEGGGSWTSLEGGVAPVPPVPPVSPVPMVAPAPPVPPMPFMMLIANSDEADRNGDGALSREEFVAQHLRFFDASDANGDGRVQFEPPTPPVPPVAPTPPEPPRRR
jgi:hypothetical protein